MNIDDEVLYTISITGLSRIDLGLIHDLPGVPKNLWRITPADESGARGSIFIPRLYTRWRGDAAEREWEAELCKTIGDKGTLLIEVRPWEPAIGYPRGEM